MSLGVQRAAVRAESASIRVAHWERARSKRRSRELRRGGDETQWTKGGTMRVRTSRGQAPQPLSASFLIGLPGVPTSRPRLLRREATSIGEIDVDQTQWTVAEPFLHTRVTAPCLPRRTTGFAARLPAMSPAERYAGRGINARPAALRSGQVHVRDCGAPGEPPRLGDEAIQLSVTGRAHAGRRRPDPSSARRTADAATANGGLRPRLLPL